MKEVSSENPKGQEHKHITLSEQQCATMPTETLLRTLHTSLAGLHEKEAVRRISIYGRNETAKRKTTPIGAIILAKFFNPLIVVLILIGAFSYFFGERISALIIGLMILLSVFLSFIQEYRSSRAVERLREMVRTTATVVRDSEPRDVKISNLVPGDLVDLYAGQMVPADLRIISSKDLYINQSSLTGESFPAEKSHNPIGKPKNPGEAVNLAFMGSTVVSGTGLGVVMRTGLTTRFGALSSRLAEIETKTTFDQGIEDFTWLMIRIMLILVAVIFAINAVLRGNPLQALLFSLAVAVGLTPEMLPVVVAVNLSKGAIDMAKKKVIVKHLHSIQDLGAMDVLCTDKTGTLTLNKIVLEKYCDITGQDDHEVLTLAYINSAYQTGLKNLLDKAILKHENFSLHQYKKIDEIPFDFSRKTMSVVVGMQGKHRIITKGAPEEIIKRCTRYEVRGKIRPIHQGIHSRLKAEYDKLSSQGFRVLAVAYADAPRKKKEYSKDDEENLILRGYVAFLDPPKPSARAAIEALKKLGIEVKILTGDNELVTEKICREVKLPIKGIVTGEEIEGLDDAQIRPLAENTTVFARLSPLQKERIIRILHQNSHVVGYLGDGINDALSLKACDVGISVNNAVDIAKESAEIILLKKSLAVLQEGVIEGRRTFGNIVKYIKMGSSSNAGNMLSMTGASIFLPFLPMLPIQILLNNFLYDLSQIAIPTDSVDTELLKRPMRWDISGIARFMRYIGPLSSLFDFLTFGVLLYALHAGQALFHTGWFIESLCTQTLVIHVIRTNKIPFIESRPSTFLLVTSLLIVSIGIALPYTPLAKPLGFVVPPFQYYLFLAGIVIGYLFLVFFVKRQLISRIEGKHTTAGSQRFEV